MIIPMSWRESEENRNEAFLRPHKLLEVKPLCSPRRPRRLGFTVCASLIGDFPCMSFWTPALKVGHCTCVSLSHRYRGSFLQDRVQLRARRLRKPLWVLRKDCRPSPLERMDPCRTLGQAASEMAGNALLGHESLWGMKRHRAAGGAG